MRAPGGWITVAGSKPLRVIAPRLPAGARAAESRTRLLAAQRGTGVKLDEVAVLFAILIMTVQEFTARQSTLQTSVIKLSSSKREDVKHMAFPPFPACPLTGFPVVGKEPFCNQRPLLKPLPGSFFPPGLLRYLSPQLASGPRVTVRHHQLSSV